MKSLEIVVVSYKRPIEIQVLVHSLAAQTSQDFRVSIYHDGFDPEMLKILDGLKLKYPGMMNFEFTDKRFNDYGHSLREIGISKATSKYILITNDDNYYCPTFVSEMLEKLASNDLVYCDMLHSHTEYKRVFRTYTRLGSIDVGSMIVRTELAKKIGWKDKSFSGDGTYCEGIMSSIPNIRIAKIRKILFVHN
jgi:GT2 family glycosyltransferase